LVSSIAAPLAAAPGSFSHTVAVTALAAPAASLTCSVRMWLVPATTCFLCVFLEVWVVV
jgi:hypothetical protein